MKKMSETDSHTGLYNRLAYEYRISEYKKQDKLPDNLILFLIDVNGLKNVNDSLGHDMGDALIYDSAWCLFSAVNGRGDCFRMGGDEFAAIIENDDADPDEIKRTMEEKAKEANKGDYEVSMSIGYAVSKGHEDMHIDELEKLADEMMYHEKENYYLSRGIDRRAQNAAFSEISGFYLKILRIDLGTESFNIIKMNIDEKNEKTGFSRNISSWIRDFAVSGMIYDEDVKEFQDKINTEYLKSYFNEGKKSLNVNYRRRIGETFHEVTTEINAVKEYSENNQIVYLLVKDNDNT